MNVAHISVKVGAGAREELLEKISDTKFKIAVREKPERNQANRRVIELLAVQFNVPVKKIRIVKGHRSPSKLFSVSI